MNKDKTFLVMTLGCKLNQLESEAVMDSFIKAGFKQFDLINERKNKHSQSFIIINTCTVTSKADQKARRVTRKALRDYPGAKVIVTGCYAQLNKDDILKLDKDGKGCLSVIEKDKIIDFIKSIGIDDSPEITNRTFTDSRFQFNPGQFSQHTRSYLKIQDGCDKHCTYCKIRLVRGKSISLKREYVLLRLRVLEERYSEAVLTGVNICQYNDKTPHEDASSLACNLPELLRYLLEGTEKIAIRLSSLSPESIDKNLCAVLSHPRIQPHFHLSVQSLSCNILKRMGRDYNAQTVINAVSLLRNVKGDPFLACDIIAGFPGETYNDFLETFNICKELDFAWIHVFPYSERPGTKAFAFTDSVSESDIAKRVRLFTELAMHGKSNYVKRFLDKDVNVLIENTDNKEKNVKKCMGTSDNYLKVLLKNKNESHPAGTVLRCKIINEGNYKEYDALALYTK